MIKDNELSCLVMGPGLLSDKSGEIKTTDALDYGGSFKSNEYRRLIGSIFCNSLTVRSEDEKTVCMITTSHSGYQRGYSLNAAFCLRGELRDTFLKGPEGFFLLYDQIRDMNAEAFREAFRDEKGPFVSLIEEIAEGIEGKPYRVSNASDLVIAALCGQVLEADRKNHYLVDTNRSEFSNSFRHMPLPLRKRLSFSFPAYDEGTELISDLVICPLDAPPRLKKKAGYRGVTVTDRELFSNEVNSLADYLFKLLGPGIKKYDDADYDFDRTIAELFKKTGLRPEPAAEPVKMQKKTFFSYGKNKAPEKSRDNQAERERKDSEVSECEQRTFSPSEKTLFLRMPLLICFLSFILYILNNLTILTDKEIILMITLRAGGFVNVFCLLLFVLGFIGVMFYLFTGNKEE